MADERCRGEGRKGRSVYRVELGFRCQRCRMAVSRTFRASLQRSFGSRLPVRDVLVIVPVYRNAGLVPGLFRSLIAAADSFRAIGGRLLIIVDSPDDEELREMLRLELPALEAAVPTELHVNQNNLGFVGSMNFGFERAIAEGRDALALNSDVVVSAGAFREMQEVAYLDHMTGFVSPRSNNATICSLPYQNRYRHRSVDDSRASFEILSPHLPRVRYVPTAVGFCLYIKWTILADFGVFDPIYGRGYNEENDLILRANQCGYRAVLANHAFVFHIGEQSFSLTQVPMSKSDLLNGKILRQRYPEFERCIAREMASPRLLAEIVLTGLLPNADGRLTVAFDWTNIGLYHNGTFEAAKEILRASARRWKDLYDIVVIGTPQAAAFHDLKNIAEVTLVAPEKIELYAAIIRVGQPFDPQGVDYFAQQAPVLVVYMLDTIALDCQYLDSPDLQDLWQYCLDSTDAIFYISQYTQTQFRSRFRIPSEKVEIASLLSLDPAEYRSGPAAEAEADSILVVGNHFAHKHIDATVAQLVADFPDAKVVVLGGSDKTVEGVTVHRSGSLDEAEIDGLYRDARVVLFPSHYEGFGLPILHALARKRPVIARAMPLYDEIKASLGSTANFYQCETTKEMVTLAGSGSVSWQDEPSLDHNGQGWDRVASDLDRGLAEALKRVSYDRLVERFERIRRKECLQSGGVQLPAKPPELNFFGYTAPLSVVGLVGSAVISVALLSAVVVLVYSAFLAFRGYSALPYWDQWQYIRPESIAASLLQFHNEHRAVVSKLLFLIDAQWFGSRNIMLFVAIYLIQALHCGILMKTALASGIAGRIRSYLVPAIAICALFGTQNYENLTWGFQTQFVLVFAMASASFLSFATFVAGGGRWWFLAALAAALIASIEMANGIAVFPLLLLFALYYRLSWKIVAIIALVMAGVGSTYAFDRMQLQSDPTAARSDLLLIAQYVLVYLGGFLGETLSSDWIGSLLGTRGIQTTVVLSMRMGVLLLACWVVFVVLMRRSLQHFRPAFLAIVCIFAFAVASATATAFGRVGFGLESALAARYVTGSSIATAATMFVILWLLSVRGGATVQAIVLSAMALILAGIALMQPRFVAMADNRRIGRDSATTALYVGAKDEDALRDAFIDTRMVVEEAAYLKAGSKSIFADPRTRLLGRKFDGPVADCAVPIGQGGVPGAGQRVSGGVELNPFLLRRPMLLLVDPQNTIVGFGFASLQNDQTRLVQLNKLAQTIPWQGHVVAGAQTPLRAVFPDKAPACEMRPTN